jgi:hypothetical protein
MRSFTYKLIIVLLLACITSVIIMAFWVHMLEQRLNYRLAYNSAETEQYIKSLVSNEIDRKCPSMVRDIQDFDVLVRQVLFHNTLWRTKYTWKKKSHHSIIRALEEFNNYQWKYQEKKR